MLLPIPIIADYNLLCNHRQIIIDENNHHEKLCRRFKNYEPGNEILKIVYNPASLEEHAIGAFVIQQVYADSTLTSLHANNV
jgi:hypothetical protein